MLFVPDMTKERNQGEGDRESARRYDRHVRDFVAHNKVGESARRAKNFVMHHPIDAAKAEREARRGPHPTVGVDELVSKGRTVLDRVRKMAHDLRAAIAKR